MSRGASRRSSASMDAGTRSRLTSSSGPPLAPAAAPPGRASGNVSPLATKTVSVGLANVALDVAAAVPYRSSPACRVTEPFV
jgi:hypothetical protein